MILQLEELIDFLEESKTQYLATVGLDGKPRVRPFQFMLAAKGRLYFCTSNRKVVFKEIQQEPFVELCASGSNLSWIRLRGKAIFSMDITLKQLILELNPLVKSIYLTPDNPDFEIFYLDMPEAIISDLCGNPPRIYQ